MDVLRQPLRVEINHPTIEEEIREDLTADNELIAHMHEAARVYDDEGMIDFAQFCCGFEHGQWWVTFYPSGRQWSVVETNEGFGFEQVSEGDGELP